jgi:hypothetical protein
VSKIWTGEANISCNSHQFSFRSLAVADLIGGNESLMPVFVTEHLLNFLA